MGHISFVGKLDGVTLTAGAPRDRAGLHARPDGQALARLLAHLRGPARPGQPRHARPRRQHRPRYTPNNEEGHTRLIAKLRAPDEATDAVRRARPRMPRGALRAQPVRRPAHPARRRRAPERHDPLRPRPADLGARRELQGARRRQPLRRRRQLLPVERRGESRAHIMANALRVGDHLLERLGAPRPRTGRCAMRRRNAAARRRRSAAGPARRPAARPGAEARTSAASGAGRRSVGYDRRGHGPLGALLRRRADLREDGATSRLAGRPFELLHGVFGARSRVGPAAPRQRSTSS